MFRWLEQVVRQWRDNALPGQRKVRIAVDVNGRGIVLVETVDAKTYRKTVARALAEAAAWMITTAEEGM